MAKRSKIPKTPQPVVVVRRIERDDTIRLLTPSTLLMFPIVHTTALSVKPI
jgi:hypothetical protein